MAILSGLAHISGGCRGGRGEQVGRIEIVFSGYADQREQRIAAGVSEGGAHAMGSCRFAGRADRPVGGDPFAGGVEEGRCELDQPSLTLDRRCLYRGNLVLAKALAYNPKATC